MLEVFCVKCAGTGSKSCGDDEGVALTFVHFVAGEWTACVVVPNFIHKHIDFTLSFVAGSKVGKPDAKQGIERRFAAACFFTRFLDESLIRAERDIFHYTIIVCTGVVVKAINSFHESTKHLYYCGEIIRGF